MYQDFINNEDRIYPQISGVEQRIWDDFKTVFELGLVKFC
jgi:hypothetical protein